MEVGIFSYLISASENVFEGIEGRAWRLTAPAIQPVREARKALAPARELRQKKAQQRAATNRRNTIEFVSHWLYNCHQLRRARASSVGR
jgi:hypothetical protein